MKKILMISLVVALLGCDNNENTKIAYESQSKIKVENEYNESENKEIDGDKAIKISPISNTETGSWHIVSHFNEEQEKLTRWASLRSENNVELDSQSEEKNRLQLDIRDSRTNKPQIFLTIDRGQFDCAGNLCSITVKFENNPSQHFTFSRYEPQVNGGVVLILSENPEIFLENVRKNNNLSIGIPFYKIGIHQFEFNISKFNEVEDKIQTS
ncbi:hypothetical protein [Acinetobacter junii]|uniref:hypothetical protein n=1 Tax=Acinetobacter junii TaxID=40215 RepID=UPI001439431A|nr:hypothetical protein [Acinetobacter junii]NKG34789.1 hypothetical protein [Acinetobacter junii]